MEAAKLFLLTLAPQEHDKKGTRTRLLDECGMRMKELEDGPHKHNRPPELQLQDAKAGQERLGKRQIKCQEEKSATQSALDELEEKLERVEIATGICVFCFWGLPGKSRHRMIICPRG